MKLFKLIYIFQYFIPVPDIRIPESESRYGSGSRPFLSKEVSGWRNCVTLLALYIKIADHISTVLTALHQKFLNFPHLLAVYVQMVRNIFVRIRILGFVYLTNGSES